MLAEKTARIRPLPQTLSEEDLRAYAEDGYLAFEGLLSPSEVRSACAAMKDLARDLHAKAKRGEAEVKKADPIAATGNYAGILLQDPATRFFVQFEAGFDPLAVPFEEAEPVYRKTGNFVQAHPAFAALARDRRIVSALEGLVGKDPILFQNMGLAKPARIGGEKPWHQDNAYFRFAPLEAIAGVWIALDDATAENGCMHVIPGGHLRGAKKHVRTSDCELAPGRIDPSEAIPVELSSGGALFFSGMLPHETPPNRSSLRRRALQFHFRGAETKKLTPEEYDALFAEEDGTPATCHAAEAGKGR